jgi:hypothetical protein
MVDLKTFYFIVQQDQQNRVVQVKAISIRKAAECVARHYGNVTAQPVELSDLPTDLLVLK